MISDYEYIIWFFAFALGSIIGSFLNVCIVRMPHEKSIVWPGSHCPHCQKSISWFDNIPLISFLFLAGRCRHYRQKISPRYFLVELLTGMLFVTFYFHFGWNILLLPYLVMLCGFVVATFVDFGHRIIPDEISVGGMIAGLLLSLMLPSLHGTDSHELALGRSALGVLIGGGSIYAMGLLGDWMFKKESMGGGDIKLMAMVGAFLGWKLAVLSFFIAPFFGAIYGVASKILTKDSTIAYGPFLCLGSLISLFYGNRIIDFLMSGYIM